MTPEEHIERVQTTVERLISDIQRLPSDVLYREPGSGEWPVMSTLAHLAELLPYWAHQAEAIARDPGKAFGRLHDDPQRIGAVEEHGHDSLDRITPRLRSGLSECLATLRALPADAWASTGQHPRRGSMTVDELVSAFIVDHAEEHAAQIQSTLRALSAAR